MDEQDLSEGAGKSKGRTILIALLALVLLGSIGLYVSGVSLKSLLFGLSTQEGEKVGVVKAVTGHLKRQPKDSLEFLEVKMNADLFNEDTVMTGPEDHTTIELFDGSILELDPGSLIRLSFETAQGVGGIERRVLVDIVAGNVKGDLSRPKLVLRRGGKPVVSASPRATPGPTATPTLSPEPASSPTPSAAPSPTPSPLPSPEPSPSPIGLTTESIKIIQPTSAQVFTVPTGQNPPVKQPLVFSAPGNPSVEVIMVLKNRVGKELLRKKVTAASGRGGLLATFERPGQYSVEIRDLNGKKIGLRGVQTWFTIAPEYEGIQTEPPLVGGEPIDSNKYMGKRLQDFDVVLRWKPLDGIQRYHLIVMSKSGQKVVDQVVVGSKYSLAKGKMPTDVLNYQVKGEYPNGYAPVSKTESFFFNFASPVQTLPKDGDAVSQADREVVKQKGVLFSWQRTTFTESYEFEIAYDAQFTKVMKRVLIKRGDNFLIFRNLKPRDYWWRVRAIVGDLKSPPAQPFKITVTP